VTNQGAAALEIKGVSKRYGETRALEQLSLACAPGTVHTIFGENGSGKSTLAKILSGIIPPDQGTIRIGDQTVTAFSPTAMRQLGVVPVLQEVLVAPNRSVIDNIFIGYDGLFRRKISRRDRLALAATTLAQITSLQFDMNELVENVPLQEQQFIVIARALVHNPRILILDEATATLDFSARDMLFAALRDFVKSGKLVLFISHRMDEVLALSDEVTVLRSGAVVATVPRGELSIAGLLKLVTTDAVSREKIHV
jgi:ribose transport system ATP-binding protein